MRVSQFLMLFLISIYGRLSAQDLSEIGNSKALKITGGFNSNQVYNTSNEKNPFSYYLGANMNIGLYGLNIPFSFSYSNRVHSFSQPFNQYGLSPKYKWITLHLGYRSLTFSNYSYSGLLFNGIGLEASPDIGLKVEAFYGRLQKAQAADTSNLSEISYKRIGQGVKVNYSFSGQSLSLNLFKASDRISSVDYIPEYSTVTPQENFVLELGGTLSIFNGLKVSMQGAGSAFTQDMRAEELKKESSMAGNFLTMRESTGVHFAGKTSLNYMVGKASFGINYERINPGYRTLGQYYMNNDIETTSLNYIQSAFKEKVNLSFNAGVEKNNLHNNKAEKTLRFVFSTNIGANISDQFQINASYSNFRNFTRIRSVFEDLNNLAGEPVDSLRFIQVNQSASLSGSVSIENSKQAKRNFSFNLTYHGSLNEEGGDYSSETFGFNESISYRSIWTESQASFTLSLNANQNIAGNISVFILGPSVSFNKSFFSKLLRSGVTAGFSTTFGNNSEIASLIIRTTNSINIKKRHHLSSIIGCVFTSNSLSGQKNNFTGSIGYSFSF